MRADAASLAELDAALLQLRRLYAAAAVPDFVDDQGRPVHMSSLVVIEAVARRGHDAEVSVGDVADFAAVDASTASRLVTRAESAGFVVRAPSSLDSRRSVLSLTPSGSGVRRRAVRYRHALLTRYTTGWPQRDVRDLARLLSRFASSVADAG